MTSIREVHLDTCNLLEVVFDKMVPALQHWVSDVGCEVV